jgi:hypothetical protein
MKRRIEVNLPTSWQDIKLKEYLAYQKALKPYEGVEDYHSISFEKAINHFCNISTEDLYSIPVESYNGLYDTVKEVFKEGYDLPLVHRFTILSTEFGFIPNLNEMSYGEYLDLVTYFKDMWANMPTIMSILYRPVVESDERTYSISTYTGTNEDTEELFKEKLTMDIVWGAIGFFLNLQKDLLKGTLIFLAKEMKNLTTDTALLEILTKNGQDISQLQSSLMEMSQSLTKLQV